MAIVYWNLSCNMVCTRVKYLCISLSVTKISENSRTDEMIVEWSWWFILAIDWKVMPNRLRQMW